MSGLSMHSVVAAALLGGILAGAAALPAAAEDATFLGQFKKWSAYSLGQGSSMVCYAISSPTAEEPRKVKRDPAYFLINDWPGRKTKGEPEIVSGYQYKEGHDLTAQVGSDKFSFMVQDDAKSGSAWVKDAADEPRLIEAMKNNAQVLVTGESKRGTMTHDVYSLAGFSDAFDKINSACGM
jgi:hypothetical protein